MISYGSGGGSLFLLLRVFFVWEGLVAKFCGGFKETLSSKRFYRRFHLLRRLSLLEVIFDSTQRSMSSPVKRLRLLSKRATTTTLSSFE